MWHPRSKLRELWLGSIPLKTIQTFTRSERSISQRRSGVESITLWSLFGTDTQRGVLTGLSRERNLRSKIWWFTEFCNSHYVSHFAAFFIVTGTKISVAKSCFGFVCLTLVKAVKISTRFKKGVKKKGNSLRRLQDTSPNPHGPRGVRNVHRGLKRGYVLMILPQVHLRKPCYDFYFL